MAIIFLPKGISEQLYYLENVENVKVLKFKTDGSKIVLLLE